MYKQFYLMEKEPFDIHPSPELFYKSNAHQNGWGYLFQGIKSNEPILLVTGEYGTGKTLLCLRLVKLLKALKKKKKLPFVYLSTPTYDFTRVLEKIIIELNISMNGVDISKESKLQQLIYDFFEAAAGKGKENCIYLVIDDAQDFNYSFINKLRLLCSYNVAGEFPIRLILFAHQDFFALLNDRKNAAMAQRIRRIYRLNPFEFEETREYIYFRLTYSGASGAPVFDDDAIALIQSASRGIPRLINNICDNCLLVSSNERLNEIDVSMVTEAMKLGNMVGVGEVQKNDSLPPTSTDYHDDSDVKEETDTNPLPRVSGGRRAAVDKISTHPDSGGQQVVHPWEAKEGGNEPFPIRDDYPAHPYVEHVEPEERSSQEGEGEKKKSSIKKGKWEYMKIGMIVILVMIILYLLFYIFSQNGSSKHSNPQSLNGQIDTMVSEYKCDGIKKEEQSIKNRFLFNGHPLVRTINNENAMSLLPTDSLSVFRPSARWESCCWHSYINCWKQDRQRFKHGIRLIRRGETQCEIG